MPTTQFTVKELHASDSRRMDCRLLYAISGLATLSSKLESMEPPSPTATSDAITCADRKLAVLRYRQPPLAVVKSESACFPQRAGRWVERASQEGQIGAVTWRQTINSASHWVGLVLPGMMDDLRLRRGNSS